MKRLFNKKPVFVRAFTMLLALLTLVPALIGAVFAEETTAPEPPLPDAPTAVNCKAAYLYNFENDKVVFDLNADEAVYPAATVKLMTALIIFDMFGDRLDDTITVSDAMVKEFAGNKIGFSAGEVVSYRQMLNCMLVNSANDAAIILAHAAAGSTDAFVRMMNEKTDWLGLTSTHYTNPTGMHSDAMKTTASDVAALAKYAYAIPGFIDITSTPKYVMEATNMSDYRNIYNRNCLISKYYGTGYIYQGTLGMSAGATEKAGDVLCAVARQGDLTYLAIIMGATDDEDEKYSYYNAISMFDWAFKAYDYKKVLSSARVVCELPVTLSQTLDYVTLVPKNDITVFIPSKIDVSSDVTYNYSTYQPSLEAPVEAGAEVGYITVLCGGEILGSCPLVTTSSINRSEFLYVLSEIKEFTGGRFFRGTLVSIVVLSLGYVLITARRREKKYRRMARR